MRFKIEYNKDGKTAVMEVEANSLESAERFVKEKYPDATTTEFAGLPLAPEADLLDELELEDDFSDEDEL